MESIHQIYGTHCNFGTSAIHRRPGELGVAGYTARAGSLGQRELAEYFRYIERFLHFHLAKDTPAELKQQLTARTAPRRMFFCPSVSGKQVAGQVCYRPYDCSTPQPRLGSYFGHVLTSVRGPVGASWSILDFLKLWSATGWRVEDGEDISYDLPTLTSPADLLEGRPPAIDDRVLLSFLRTPAGGEFYSPDPELIPPRWQAAEPAERRALLRSALAGYLDIAPQRRDSVLLVVEPSIAALIFYGVARLLPDQGLSEKGQPEPGLRDELSCSTYEADGDRLTTSLAAIRFHSDTGDVAADRYRRGVVINTFLNKSSEIRGRQARYVDTMLEILCQRDGWDGVDRVLHSLGAAGVRRLDDLDHGIRAETLVREVLTPTVPISDPNWRQSPLIVKYLRSAVCHKLVDASPQALTALAQSPDHLLTVLELTADVPALAAAVEQLAGHLVQSPPEGDTFAQFLALEQVVPALKSDLLLAYVKEHAVKEHAALPPGCDYLWAETLKGLHAARGAVQPGSLAALLPNVFPRLNVQTLRSLHNHLPADSAAAFFICLTLVPRDHVNHYSLLQELCDNLDEATVTALVDRHADLLREAEFLKQTHFGRLLYHFLDQLHNEPSKFAVRLEALGKLENLLPAGHDRLEAWVGVRKVLQEANKKAAQPPEGLADKLLRRSAVDVEYVGEKLSAKLKLAMPRPPGHDDANLQQMSVRQRQLAGEAEIQWRISAVQAIAKKLNIDPAIFPDDFVHKTVYFYKNNRWPTAGRSTARRKGAGKPFSIPLIIVGAMAAMLLFGAGYRLFVGPSPAQVADTKNSTGKSQQEPKASKNTDSAPTSKVSPTKKPNQTPDEKRDPPAGPQGEKSPSETSTSPTATIATDESPAGKPTSQSVDSAPNGNDPVPGNASEEPATEASGDNGDGLEVAVADPKGVASVRPESKPRKDTANSNLATEPIVSVIPGKGRPSSKSEIFDLLPIPEGTKCTLHIHGLGIIEKKGPHGSKKDVNLRDVRTVPGTPPCGVNIVAEFDNMNDRNQTLAKIDITDKCLHVRVEWSTNYHVARLQDMLRFLVIELKVDDTSKPQYIALQNHEPTRPFSVVKGTGLDMPDSLDHAVRFGAGQLMIPDKDAQPFGDDENPSKHYELVSKDENESIQRSDLRLQVKSRIAKIDITTTPVRNDEDEVELRKLEERRKRITKFIQEATIKQGKWGKLSLTEKKTAYDVHAKAIAALATECALEPVKPFEEAQRTGEKDDAYRSRFWDYYNDADIRIIRKAAQQGTKLDDEIAPLKNRVSRKSSEAAKIAAEVKFYLEVDLDEDQSDEAFKSRIFIPLNVGDINSMVLTK